MSHKRFSTLTYLAEQKQEHTVMQDTQSNATILQQICDEMRQFLVTPQGYTHEEKAKYNEQLTTAVLGFTEARQAILTLIEDRLAKLHIDLHPSLFAPYMTLAEAIFSEVVGFNVLEIVMKQYEQLEEIQVVGLHIFVVVNGQVLKTPYQFQHIKEVERLQQNLVLYNNDMINFDKRWAEVMLQNGARVTLTGFGFTSTPTLTIRFFTLKHISLAKLGEEPYKMMPKQVVDWLIEIVQRRKNIIIIGQTNSGKTNLLKALIAEMREEERIITIESRLEMMLKRDFPARNIVEYEVSEQEQHNGEQALKLALRQSPERIIHAEIRDEDANIYVRACTRGHQGSMTTVHANHLEDVPDVIVDMCLLDKRGMDTLRMLKRVTEYVSQIGVQLALHQGKRVIQRIVFYKWINNEVMLFEVLNYDKDKQDWILNEKDFWKFINE